MTIRILVTGSREWDDEVVLHEILDDMLMRFGERIVIVHGACYPKADEATGGRPKVSADYLAHLWCVACSVPEEPHPADWYPNGKLDKGAGPARNQVMVDLGAKVCLAFPTAKSRGTWDCIKRANRAGIPVRIVPARGAKK